jgi:hypothetical protein
MGLVSIALLLSSVPVGSAPRRILFVPGEGESKIRARPNWRRKRANSRENAAI